METLDNQSNSTQNNVSLESVSEASKPQSGVNFFFRIYTYIVLILTVIGGVFIFIDLNHGGNWSGLLSLFIAFILGLIYLSLGVVYLLKTSVNVILEKKQTGASLSSILKNRKIAIIILIFFIILGAYFLFKPNEPIIDGVNNNFDARNLLTGLAVPFDGNLYVYNINGTTKKKPIGGTGIQKYISDKKINDPHFSNEKLVTVGDFFHYSLIQGAEKYQEKNNWWEKKHVSCYWVISVHQDSYENYQTMDMPCDTSLQDLGAKIITEKVEAEKAILDSIPKEEVDTYTIYNYGEPINGPDAWVTKKQAYKICKEQINSQEEDRPNAKTYCTWGKEIIYGEKVEANYFPKGIFVYKLDGKIYSGTNKIVKDLAVNLCKIYTKENSKNKVYCTWNNEVVYGTK